MTIDHPKVAQIPQLRRLWQLAFGDSAALLDDFFRTGFSYDRCRCITMGADMATMLYWFEGAYSEGKIAYLYAVATDRAYQHRGLCRTLMTDTHRLLKEAGFSAAVLVPGSRELFSFYEKMGYRPFGGIRKFSCLAAFKKIPLRQIEKEEFIRLRKEYLPAGGVLQEDEAVDFLRTQAEFYAGEDFLLTAVKSGDRLYAPELLGNTKAAPYILRSLGFQTGQFRTPGKHPFAMFLPLSDPALPPPAYFGLALD